MTYTDKLSLNLNSGAVFEVNQDIYKETAFKRFQVVFLSTLPLTMFITYSAVQIYEMSKQKTTSPVMSKSNLQFVIGFSVTSSAVIATKDLIHWKKHQKKKNDGKSASEK
ncbi:MAG: hypothetical protein PHV06_02365 [bacterium]|nr:hypothetical protein [bacterium]